MKPGIWAAVALATCANLAAASEPEAAERGRLALTGKSHISPAWGVDAYENVGKLWGPGSPDPKLDPAGYADAFNRRYGLQPAPYSNDGLPMGLRKAVGRRSGKLGLQIDCMVCHGGSIGGTSYLGLGNSQLDLVDLLNDLTKADGRPATPSLFTLNSSRGTVNAGQLSILLLSLRNSDLSRRLFPLNTGARLAELDVPPWWILAKKATQYYDGRTDARDARSNMQFMLGELSLEEFKGLEPTFRDIQSYLKSITPPKYPFAVDAVKASAGKQIFDKTCAGCHGTYGPGGEYPSRIVPIAEIKTDRVRLDGISDKFVAHYNSTWFGGEYPVDAEKVGYQAPPLDGIWASAPYLHNGSVPTVHALLNSAERPARFKRPPSTGFENYDAVNLGWKFEPCGPVDPKAPAVEAQQVFDSGRWGLGNGGHTFGDKLSEDQRMAVIEYLKTL